MYVHNMTVTNGGRTVIQDGVVVSGGSGSSRSTNNVSSIVSGRLGKISVQGTIDETEEYEIVVRNKKTGEVIVPCPGAPLRLDRSIVIQVEGNALSVDLSNGSVRVGGNVNGSVTTSNGSIQCGDVMGNATTSMGSISASKIFGRATTTMGNIIGASR